MKQDDINVQKFSTTDKFSTTEQESRGFNNDVDDLLNDYGVTVETSTGLFDIDERLEKMQQRLLTDSSSANNSQKKSVISFILWLIGCILLVALSVVQYAVFNINSLVKQPTAQAKLVTVCNILYCRLPSADLSKLHIAKVQHGHSRVGDFANETDIFASIVNVSNVKQLYPNLKISIYGVNGLLAELVLQPKDYLLSEKQIEMATAENFFMLTVPINDDDIRKIDIVPFY